MKLNTKLLQQMIGLGTILLTSACASPQLRVDTDPAGVDVYIVNPGNKDKQLIGKTPLEISFSELNRRARRSEGDPNNLAMLSIEGKDGEPEKVLVPLVSVGLSSMSIKIPLPKGNDERNTNVILQRLQNAQKFAQAGDFDRAQSECDKILDANPYVVRAVTMKASLYYVQKKLDQAQIWYEKALALDPNMREANDMIFKIKQERR